MSSIAKEAYNVALGPNHPWIVRTVANAAMIACKSRENFMSLVCEEQTRVLGREYSQS